MLGDGAVPLSKSRAKDRMGMRVVTKTIRYGPLSCLVLILVTIRGGAAAPFLRYLEGTPLALGS